MCKYYINKYFVFRDTLLEESRRIVRHCCAICGIVYTVSSVSCRGRWVGLFLFRYSETIEDYDLVIKMQWTLLRGFKVFFFLLPIWSEK